MQLSYAIGVDGLTLSSKPSAVIALDGLKPYYCSRFSFETFDVISVWLLLCYKSFEYCVCQHYRSRDDTEAQRLDGLRSTRYISLARWLAALMWDFLLFVFSTQPPPSYSIPPIVLCPWLTLTYCVKVEKSLRLLKYETIAWLVIGVVHDESILVWRKWSMTKLYDFVGMNFLCPCYFEKTWLLS